MPENDTTNPENNVANAEGNVPAQHLILQKIYLKDLSWETPGAPQIFTVQGEPEIKVDMQSKAQQISEGNFEVVLSITATAKVEEQTSFLVEAHQAGIFAIQGYSPEQLGAILGSHCPNLLFPFAREAISDLVTKGGFPQLLLQPVNFDILYQQHLQQQQAQAKQQAAAPSPEVS